MIGYIYELRNNINGKSYVGQTIDIQKRLWKHKSIAKTKNYKNTNKFYTDLDLFGINNFTLIILESCDANLLDEKERYWIKKLNTIEPNGYNILVGGHKLYKTENPFYGKHHTNETKEKISKKNKNRNVSDDERKMRSNINLNKKNPFYEKHHTNETKEKIKQANIKNGTYIKSSERMKKNNPNKNGKYSKKVKCVMLDPTTKKIIKEFKSLTNASEYCMKSKLSNSKFIRSICSTISYACKNNTKAYGYFWKFL